VPTGTERRDTGRDIDPSRADIAALFARYREVARRPERPTRIVRERARSRPAGAARTRSATNGGR
jgi:hypothetical protein